MIDELLSEFIFDSRDHLGTAGAQLLELEKNPTSLTSLNALMGTLHTIKGNSGFLDLQHLYKLLHHAESLLQTVRDQRSACLPKMVDLLLQVLDTVEAILDRLEGGENDQVDWLEPLTLALYELETQQESISNAEGQTPEVLEETNEIDTEIPAQDTITLFAEEPKEELLPSPPQIVIDEDLSGQINLMELTDGQLETEANELPPKVEAMFKAGLSGLIIDLRELATISSGELKTLVAIGNKNSAQTAVLLDIVTQAPLYRIFQILHLDAYLHFFQNREEAMEYMESN